MLQSTSPGKKALWFASAGRQNPAFLAVAVRSGVSALLNCKQEGTESMLNIVDFYLTKFL